MEENSFISDENLNLVHVYLNCDKREACSVPLEYCNKLTDFKKYVADELDLHTYQDIRVYGYKGNELVDDVDILNIPKNGILFITTRSI